MRWRTDVVDNGLAERTGIGSCLPTTQVATEVMIETHTQGSQYSLSGSVVCSPTFERLSSTFSMGCNNSKATQTGETKEPAQYHHPQRNGGANAAAAQNNNNDNNNSPPNNNNNQNKPASSTKKKRPSQEFSRDPVTEPPIPVRSKNRMEWAMRSKIYISTEYARTKSLTKTAAQPQPTIHPRQRLL
jgi:hypothetical protein